MQRVIRPAGRRQKQPRGQGGSRATSVVSAAATDDDGGQPSNTEAFHTGVNLVAGLAPDVDAIVDEMISEEDWHVGPTLSVSCTEQFPVSVDLLTCNTETLVHLVQVHT